MPRQTTGTVKSQCQVALNPRVIRTKLDGRLEDFNRLWKALQPPQGDAQIAVGRTVLRIGRDRLREPLSGLLHLSLFQKSDTLFVESRGRITTRRLRKKTTPSQDGATDEQRRQDDLRSHKNPYTAARRARDAR